MPYQPTFSYPYNETIDVTKVDGNVFKCLINPRDIIYAYKGEVIDSDSLAEAEKTLNSIGISIREVVNGQNELRNPMTILTELAGKWKDLNSVQQSAIQEALAGRLLPERIEMCA